MEYLSSIILFAVFSSITPGPNNVMVMTSGLNFGVKESLPLLSGICVGFATMLLLVGFGIGQLFILFPELNLTLKMVGATYLFYLAWLIAKSHNMRSENRQSQPLGFFKGFIFQWVNAKAWIVAIGAVATFSNSADTSVVESFYIAMVFFFISFPCVGVWLMFGSLLREKFKSTRYLRWFNVSMSALLVFSILPILRDIFLHLQIF